MKKTWDQMTDAERVQDLRRDILTLFSALNASEQEVRRLSDRLMKAETELADKRRAEQFGKDFK